MRCLKRRNLRHLPVVSTTASEFRGSKIKKFDQTSVVLPTKAAGNFGISSLTTVLTPSVTRLARPRRNLSLPSSVLDRMTVEGPRLCRRSITCLASSSVLIFLSVSSSASNWLGRQMSARGRITCHRTCLLQEAIVLVNDEFQRLNYEVLLGMMIRPKKCININSIPARMFCLENNW